MRHLWSGRLLRFHRDQKGQAIFLGLFYFMLLAALVFLVINSGKRTTNKISMQNTADAAALGGGMWVARGMNTISMCNVTQTQLMSVIVLLDTMETVSPAAQQIIDELLSNIGASAHGSDVPNNPVISDWLIVNNARLEQEMIRKLNDVINDIPVSQYCDYDSGVLWQCCLVLNELKVQMADLAPEMAQRELQNIGEKVGDDTVAEAAFILPFYPALPIERASIDNPQANFRLFRRPMRDGRRVYDRRSSIGGFAHLQNYRSRRSGGVLGPFRYMREPLCEPTPMGALELSRFSVLFTIVSDKKFEMLFGAPNQKACLAPENRIEDYDELLQFVQDNGRDAVIHTYWTTLGFDSRYEYNTPSFDGNVDLRHQKYPRERLRVYDGFQAAPNGYRRATTQGEGADPRHDLWYRSVERETPHYPALGIYATHPPPWDEGDNRPYYRNSFWRFDGADVGEEEELHRRYLPPVGNPPRMAPIVLHRQEGTRTDENIFNRFTIVGFAYTKGESLFIPKWFPEPLETDGRLVCYAQAEIFNDTASYGPRNRRSGWDLFTQNWRVRLSRMDHWDWARSAISGEIPEQAAVGLDRATILAPVVKMLEQYEPEDVDYITH